MENLYGHICVKSAGNRLEIPEQQMFLMGIGDIRRSH